jgi:hypothetical protein
VPGFGSGFPQFTGTSGSGFPSLPDFGSGAVNPIQFWVQAAEMWQKGWQQAISTWVDAQQNTVNKGPSSTKTNSR